MWTAVRDALVPKLNKPTCPWYGSTGTLEELVGPWARSNGNLDGGLIDPHFCPHEPSELLDALDGWIEYQCAVETEIMTAHARTTGDTIQQSHVADRINWLSHRERALIRPVIADQTSRFAVRGPAYEDAAARTLRDLCHEAISSFANTLSCVVEMPYVVVPDFSIAQRFCDPAHFAPRGPNLHSVRLGMRTTLEYPDFRVDMIVTAMPEEDEARSPEVDLSGERACGIALLFTYIPLT